MEERSETNREDARGRSGTSTSHIDEDNIARAEQDAAGRRDETASDPAELRTRGDRKGGSTSSSG